MSDIRRYRPVLQDVSVLVRCGEHPDGEYVEYAALVAARQRIAALTQDCNIMCNALQRIEAGEKEPHMIARRTLEHWSEKAALS
jgi:hypothetical protein